MGSKGWTGGLPVGLRLLIPGSPSTATHPSRAITRGKLTASGSPSPPTRLLHPHLIHTVQLARSTASSSTLSAARNRCNVPLGLAWLTPHAITHLTTHPITPSHLQEHPTAIGRQGRVRKREKSHSGIVEPGELYHKSAQNIGPGP